MNSDNYSPDARALAEKMCRYHQSDEEFEQAVTFISLARSLSIDDLQETPVGKFFDAQWG